jgi:hypothetical protein
MPLGPRQCSSIVRCALLRLTSALSSHSQRTRPRRPWSCGRPRNASRWRQVDPARDEVGGRHFATLCPPCLLVNARGPQYDHEWDHVSWTFASSECGRTSGRTGRLGWRFATRRLDTKKPGRRCGGRARGVVSRHATNAASARGSWAKDVSRSVDGTSTPLGHCIIAPDSTPRTGARTWSSRRRFGHGRAVFRDCASNQPS